MFQEKINNIKKVMYEIANLKKQYKKDLFHNNYHRSLLQKHQLMSIFGLSDEDIILDPQGTSGPDMVCKKLNIYNGELKVTWMDNRYLTVSSLGKICFDKQHDELRRKQVFNYDALMYSKMTREGEIPFSLFLHCGIKQFHLILEKYQSQKIQKFQEDKNLGKRTRDDIQIPVIEVIRKLHNEEMLLIRDGKCVDKYYFLSNLKSEKIPPV